MSGRIAVAIMAFMTAATAVLGSPETAWTPCGWGGGGYYWSSVFDPRNSGVIYLGGDVAGIYKSEDEGNTWRFINRGLSNYDVYALAIAPSESNTLLAGTTSGICKTTDGGANWRFLESTDTKSMGIAVDRYKSVDPLAFDPVNADVVYAGSVSGKVFKSVDGGKTWAMVHDFGSGTVSSVAVAPGGKLILAMHSESGLALSKDGGAQWTKVDGPGGGYGIAVCPTDRKIAYAAFGKHGVWKSDDGGSKWHAINTGMEKQLEARQVVMHPKDPRKLWCVATEGWGGVVMRSVDSGKTWAVARTLRRNPSNPTLPGEGGGLAGEYDLSALGHLTVSTKEPDKLFVAGNWRNAWSSDGGKTWEERDAGADISVITDIQFAGTRTFVTAMDEGLLASPDQGKTWQQLAPLKWSPDLSGHQWRVKVLDSSTGRKLVSTVSLWDEGRPHPNKILVSNDGGATFAAVTEGLPKGSTGLNAMWGRSYARAIDVDPNDPNTVYLGIDGDPDPEKDFPGGGVYKSSDGGMTWKRLASQPGSLRMFYGLVVDPSAPSTIYWAACGENGGLYRSMDAGGSWTRIFNSETWLFNAMVSPSGVVYATGQNLWKSGDQGKTWAKLTSFDDRVVVGLTLDPADENRIWISRTTWDSTSQGGVYRSGDGGKTWDEITGDIPYRKPLILRYNPATRELWAGGSGLFRVAQ